MPRQWGLRKFQTRVSFVARAAAMLAMAFLLFMASFASRVAAQDAGTFSVSFSGNDASGSYQGSCGP